MEGHHHGHHMASASTENAAAGSSSMMTHFFLGLSHQEVLFAGWMASGPLAYVALCALMFTLAVAREYVLAWRTRLVRTDRDAARKRARQLLNSDDDMLLGGGGGGGDAGVSPLAGGGKAGIVFDLPTRCRHAALYALALVLAYLQMLAVMTFNAAFFLAMIAGALVGNTVFAHDPHSLDAECH